MKRMAWFSASLATTLLLGAAPAGAQPHERPMNRSAGLAVKPFFNVPTSQTFTLVGVEMLGDHHNGWLGGMGWYGGLDLGIKSYSSLLEYGGLLVRREIPLGPLDLSAGVLGGFGYTTNVFPNLTFSNFYFYGVLEPQIGLVQVFDNGARMGIDLSYLVASVPERVRGPVLTLRFSMPFGGHRMMR